ncbi:MAG: universal stress protein [Actinomycetales bacterium]|nr:universal stress protein [Actinomycetales bacterium]
MSSSQRLIVVGVDGSPGSVGAVDWAAAEAHRRGAGLELLYAEVPTPPVVGMEPGPVAPVTAETAPSFLTEARDRVLLAWPGLDVRTVPMVGGPASSLITASADADLLVVGAHGRSMIARLLLGSVGHHVATHATCTAVVVRGEGHGATAPVAVGIDDSPTSRYALEVAFEEASLRGVPLVVFHAWQDLPITGYGVWAPPPGVTDELRAAGEELVATALQGWPEKYPDVEVHTRVEHNHPVTAVVEESAHAQLVVLGAHGRGHVAGMDFGSVPSAAVREAACPVMVVRPPRAETTA